MSKSIFERVTLRDGNESYVNKYAENKTGLSLGEMHPTAFNMIYKDAASRKIHDGNFAYVRTELSKLHETVYEPQYNTNYGKDIPVSVGGGLVDFVDYFSVEWAGMPTEEQNLTGNNVNIIPRVQAKLNHRAVDVYNFEIAYDLKFIEIDKLQKVQFAKALETIYRDAILAGFDLFVDKIAYLGVSGKEGLFTSDKVIPTVIPRGSQDATKAGFEGFTDEEIVGFFNGVLTYYLINSNNNINILPDTFLIPLTDSGELSSRFSDLYTNNLRNFIIQFNVGKDEAENAGVTGFTLKIKGRPLLNGKGTLNAGRIVAYKYDIKNVRLDIPYPVQVYFTSPNIERAAYTTIFVGQVSQIQLPYNSDNQTFGAVSYWDFTPAQATVSFNANGGTGSITNIVTSVGSTITLPLSTGLTPPTDKDFKGWGLTPDATATAALLASSEFDVTETSVTLYAIWD